MSWLANYKLVTPAKSEELTLTHHPDRMAVVASLHRVAQVACERIMLMMNNTEMIHHRRLRTLEEVLTYLEGLHDDVGCNGDRGDFYRRKLAEQMYRTFAIHGVDHTNVLGVVDGAMRLERDTRLILRDGAKCREAGAPVLVDPTLLDILGRIAGMH